ncbi:MAG: hypothetical protein V1678_00715 [Candidatus Aenigmatarchaeota archaeon]
MYKEAFWTLIFITVMTLALQMSGYAMMETVLFLVVMDFIALWIYLESRKYPNALNEHFIRKLEGLEKSCSSISESIGAVTSVLNLEERVDRQREDVSSMLESINQKNLALEDKLNGFGRFLERSLNEEKEKLQSY